MKKIVLLLMLVMPVIAHAQTDANTLDLTELTVGNGDVVLYVVNDPNGTPVDRRISFAELIGYWLGSANITTLGTIGTGVWQGTAIADAYVANDITASNYQPLEATLTDIADGTISENLVNTANPWADNEVADDITCSNYQPLEATLTDIADGTITENLVNTANPWADNEVANDITCSNYLDLATYDVSSDGVADGNDVVYGSAWNGDVNAVAMDRIYDYLHLIDTDDDASLADESWLTDIFLSAADANEYIQDQAGGMFTGNTETGITVTYQDGDGTVDFVVDVTGSSSTTFTNKTYDADGTGNVLSNVDEDNCKDASDLVRSGIEFAIDGGGSEIADNVTGWVEIPFNCTIIRATALADQSGSIVVDLWQDTYANYPPTDADTITAAAPVTITTATKSQDTTLSGWTTALTAGSVLKYNVDSCTTITHCVVSLVVEK